MAEGAQYGRHAALEIIHLRLAGQLPESLIREIRDAVIHYDHNMVVRIYRHVAVETDLAIHIRMAAPSSSQVEAELGVRLSTVLRRYGMVAHSVWIKQQEEATKTLRIGVLTEYRIIEIELSISKIRRNRQVLQAVSRRLSSRNRFLADWS